MVGFLHLDLGLRRITLNFPLKHKQMLKKAMYFSVFIHLTFINVPGMVLIVLNTFFSFSLEVGAFIIPPSHR